jgi:alkylation response protein AidB-like acyl-CoA dehydrogenase
MPETKWTNIAAELAESFQLPAQAADVTGDFSVAAVIQLRDSGVLSALVPADHGGGGATHAEMGDIIRHIGRTDASTALTLSMHAHVLGLQVWRHKQGMDATGIFSKVVGGAFLVSTGASDWLASTGETTPVEGGYEISGIKTPASGCEAGDIMATSIRWESPDGPKVLHFPLPFSAPGVSIKKTWDPMGLRASGSHTIVFDKVFVAKESISLERPADIWAPLLGVVVVQALPMIMSAYVGIADSMVSLAVKSAQGKADPALAPLIGEMKNAYQQGADAVSAMFVAADNFKFDNTPEGAATVLSRKTNAVAAFLRVADLGMEVIGGRGFARGHHLERLYRDMQGCQFHPLPRTKQTTLTGRVALGLPPV